MPPPALPDLWVMFRPAAAYKYLRGLAVAPTRWIAIRRPLFLCVALGCIMSLLTEGRITLRLAIPAAVYWSFIPLLQAACVAISHRRVRPEIPLARAIDLSFGADGPWFLWLLVYCSFWVLLPPDRAYRLASYHTIWYSAAVFAGLWSAYIDYWFFRTVFGSRPGHAGGLLVLYRAACWSAGLIIFVLPAGWQTVAGWLGL
jgi:hypothetical protein